MHRAAAVTELRRDGLCLVDRSLGRLELLAVVGDDASLRELRLQRLHVRFRDDRRGGTADEEAIRGGSRDHRAAEQKGQPALHEADATVSLGACLAPRRLVPEWRKKR